MNRQAQAIVVALVGLLLILITASGQYTSYVRPLFGPIFLVSGALLMLLGVAGLTLSVRDDTRASKAATTPVAAAGVTPAGSDSCCNTNQSERCDSTTSADHGHAAHDDDCCDHDRSRAPWLALAPVLVLLLIAPPALGADAVARNATSQAWAGTVQTAPNPTTGADPADRSGAGGGTSGGGYAFNDGSGSVTDDNGSRRIQHYPPLPDEPAPTVTLKDFVLRSLYDADYSIYDRTVTVTGFLAPPGEGFTDGHTIARIAITCCAADANPLQLHVAGDAPYPVDTWVTATVTLIPDTATLTNGYVPTVVVHDLQTIPQPDDPYEH